MRVCFPSVPHKSVVVQHVLMNQNQLNLPLNHSLFLVVWMTMWITLSHQTLSLPPLWQRHYRLHRLKERKLLLLAKSKCSFLRRVHLGVPKEVAKFFQGKKSGLVNRLRSLCLHSLLHHHAEHVRDLNNLRLSRQLLCDDLRGRGDLQLVLATSMGKKGTPLIFRETLSGKASGKECLNMNWVAPIHV